MTGTASTAASIVAKSWTKWLVEIASIAHHGGLTGHDSNDIRRLTLPFWDMAECARLQERVIQVHGIDT
jgi:hypothetical protein